RGSARRTRTSRGLNRVSSVPQASIGAMTADVDYDPWREAADRWPELQIRLEPMSGRLLGWLSYPIVALRRDSSAAQQRCTLAHELVHLERGTLDCGPWAAREERLVHAEAARRLVPVSQLAGAVQVAGGTHDLAALARTLDVD